MSDAAQGPGWWIASDGKWYPPEQHPDVRNQAAATAAAAAQAQAQQAQAQQAQAQQAQAQQAQAQQSPFQPAQQAQAQQAPPSWGQAGQQQGWGDSWGSARAAGASGTGGPRSRASMSVPLPGFVKKQPKIAGAVAAVVVIAVVLVLVLSGGSSNGSPTAVAGSAVSDLSSGDLAGICSLEVPAEQQTCRANLIFAAAAKITTTDIAVGNVTTEGNEALATVTGKICISTSFAGNSQSNCQSNTDPNKALDSGQGFVAEFVAASAGGNGVSSFVIPLMEEGGSWYIYQATPSTPST